MAVSLNKLKILGAFVRIGKPLCGKEITATTKINSGSLYPALIGLKKSRFLTSQWEKGDPVKLGRPLQRIYTITEAGKNLYQKEVKELVLGAQ
jgi:DNA-binding PadR family transcriptional regulator